MEPMQEIRMFILGPYCYSDGQYRKELRKSLSDNDYVFTNDDSTPNGILFTELTWDNQYKLNIWDFGTIFGTSSVHLPFFSENAVYLLAWDAKNGSSEDNINEAKLKEWVRIIRNFGGTDSPIIIAVNCYSANNPSKPAEDQQKAIARLSDAYAGKLVDLLAVNYDEPDQVAIQALKTTIQRRAEGLSNHMRKFAGLPKARAWLDKKATESAVISYQEYWNYCEAENISNAKDIAIRLHNMGKILYFSKYDELKQQIYLLPEKIVSQLYAVIRNRQRELRPARERLNVCRLDEGTWISASCAYQVLAGLSMAFQERPNSNRYIVIDALSDGNPYREGELPHHVPIIARRYRYETLPPDIMNRIIALLHQYLEFYEGATQCWRRCARFRDEKEGANAIIRLHEAEKYLDVYVFGGNRLKFLKRIEADIERINESYNKEYISISKRIPCTLQHTKTCPRQDCQIDFPYDICYAKRNTGISIPCIESGSSNLSNSISELLGEPCSQEAELSIANSNNSSSEQLDLDNQIKAEQLAGAQIERKSKEWSIAKERFLLWGAAIVAGTLLVLLCIGKIDLEELVNWFIALADKLLKETQ